MERAGRGAAKAKREAVPGRATAAKGGGRAQRRARWRARRRRQRNLSLESLSGPYEMSQQAFYKQNGDTFERAFDRIIAPVPTPFLRTKDMGYHSNEGNPIATVQNTKKFRHRLLLLRAPTSRLAAFRRVAVRNGRGPLPTRTRAGLEEPRENCKRSEETVDPAARRRGTTRFDKEG